MRTVWVRLAANVTGYVAGVKTAAGATRQLNNELMQAAAAGKLDRTTASMMRLGTVMVGVAAGAVFLAARFDKAMSAAAAAAQATGDEMDRLREAALQAGADTAFTATEAAAAIENLAKAGVSTRDILAGGLRGALDLAAAGELEVAEAAEIAASAMTQFGLAGAAVPHVADLLAAAAGKAQGDVHDMGMALQQVGVVANQAGLSIEETTAGLAAFASAGMVGSDAGTSFKTMLQRLVAPSEKAATLMERLGIDAFDAQGNFVGLAKFAGELESGLSDLTVEQRNAALATIFGSDAIRSAALLYDQGEAGVRKWIRAVDDSGFASDQAAKRLDNLAGDAERLLGSLETLAISSGGGLTAGLRTATQAAEGFVNALNDMPDIVGQIGVGFLAGGGILTLLIGGALRAKATWSELNAEIAAIGPMGERVAGTLGKIGKAVGLIGVGAGAVALVILGLNALGKAGQRARVDTDALAESLRNYALTGKATGEFQERYGASFKKLVRELKATEEAQRRVGESARKMNEAFGADPAGIGAKKLPGANLTRFKADVEDLDKALAKMATEGGATQAKLVFGELRERLIDAGMSTREINKLFPEYADAANAAAVANTGLAKGFGDADSNARTLAGGLQEAVAAGQTLIDVFNQLNGAAIGYARAEIAAEEAADKLTAALKASGGSMDTNTAKGRAAKTAMLNLVEAAAAAAQAKYEETNSVEAAQAVYDEYIGALHSARRAGLITEKQLKDLIATYGKMPPSVTTKFNTPNLAWALRTVKQLGGEIRTLPSGKTIVITTINRVRGAKVPGGFIPEREGGVVHAAQRGLVTPAHVAVGTRIKFAEPATGGEAYIPRLGNEARSREIAEIAAGWYGGRITWPGQRGGGGAGMTVNGPLIGEVKAYSNQFSTRQVLDDVAMTVVV